MEMSDRRSGAGRDCESASKNFCMSPHQRIVIWRCSVLRKSPALSAGAPDGQSRLWVRARLMGALLPAEVSCSLPVQSVSWRRAAVEADADHHGAEFP